MASRPPASQASKAITLPPGWYPDPVGDGFRWWNGDTWSDYVAPTERKPPSRRRNSLRSRLLENRRDLLAAASVVAVVVAAAILVLPGA